MKIKYRKAKPQPPKWYWFDSDNCYQCKNRNNCSGKGCKFLKKVVAIQNNKKKREII